MTWSKLTKTQQRHCRSLVKSLDAAGVRESVSQVAKYYEDTCAWEGGMITLAELCKRTGWDQPQASEPPAPAESEPAEKPEPAESEPDSSVTEAPPAAPVARLRWRADRVKQLREELTAELREMRSDITSADRQGTARNEIVRSAAGGLSKAKVFEHLGYTDTRTLTEQALKAVGVPEDFIVSLSERPAGQLNIQVVRFDDSPSSVGSYNFLCNVERALRERGLILHDDTVDTIRNMVSGGVAEVAKRTS